MTIKKVLTVAGSDPSGGAGIQADLKTFSALGCYGMSVITALTAQNTQGVQGVHFPPPEFVAQQLESVLNDIHVSAAKIGMAGSSEAIGTIAMLLRGQNFPLVLDPVMVAQSGDRLISDESIVALKTQLIPLATVITPNLPEGEVLLGRKITEPVAAAQELRAAGAKAVLLKGGHDAGDRVRDVLAWEGGVEIFDSPRIHTRNTHGTGCTLSAALTCFLGHGLNLKEAAAKSKAYITEAIRHADELQIGKGAGPVHHFHAVWDNPDE